MSTRTAPPMDDITLLGSALELVERRVRLAATARALAEADASAPPRRLSAKAWRAAALRQAGGDTALVATLRNVLTTRGAQFQKVAAYVDAIASAIREREWRGIPAELAPAPGTWRADREAAEREIALIGGFNLWHAIVLAVESVAERTPEAFGQVDDPVEEERQRQAPKDRADAALRAVEEIPLELLIGRAWTLGVEWNPVSNLARRLVDNAMNRSAGARRAPEQVGEVTLLGARR